MGTSLDIFTAVEIQWLEQPFTFNLDKDSSSHCGIIHYENTPIQLYWKVYHQKMKIFR